MLNSMHMSYFSRKHIWHCATWENIFPTHQQGKDGNCFISKSTNAKRYPHMTVAQCIMFIEFILVCKIVIYIQYIRTRILNTRCVHKMKIVIVLMSSDAHQLSFTSAGCILILHIASTLLLLLLWICLKQCQENDAR